MEGLNRLKFIVRYYKEETISMGKYSIFIVFTGIRR